MRRFYYCYETSEVSSEIETLEVSSRNNKFSCVNRIRKEHFFPDSWLNIDFGCISDNFVAVQFAFVNFNGVSDKNLSLDKNGDLLVGPSVGRIRTEMHVVPSASFYLLKWSEIVLNRLKLPEIP